VAWLMTFMPCLLLRLLQFHQKTPEFRGKHEPAWRTKPSWYLVTTEDKMIPPDAQRAMSKRAGSTVVEVKGSHAIYVSQPRAVADLIEQAAKKAKAASA
jgi:pimeloyl-ACP methyl ester carboxylesterase